MGGHMVYGVNVTCPSLHTIITVHWCNQRVVTYNMNCVWLGTRPRYGNGRCGHTTQGLVIPSFKKAIFGKKSRENHVNIRVNARFVLWCSGIFAMANILRFATMALGLHVRYQVGWCDFIYIRQIRIFNNCHQIHSRQWRDNLSTMLVWGAATSEISL